MNSVLQRNASRFVSLIHTAHALAQATFDQRAEEVQMPIAALTLSDPLKVKRSGSAEKSIGIERSLSGASIPENKPFGHHLGTYVYVFCVLCVFPNVMLYHFSRAAASVLLEADASHALPDG